MTKDAEREERLRTQIVDAAAELFAERGYGGTRLPMVAERAGVSAHTVKRLTGGRAELFASVVSARARSQAADRLADAAGHPDRSPPMAVLLEAIGEIFADPERSWSPLELEAILRSHRNAEVRASESQRLRSRWVNVRTVTDQLRRSGGLEAGVDDDAFAHFALALSVGLAMVDPLVERRPTQREWNALMARIGGAVAPPDLFVQPHHPAPQPWRLRVEIPSGPGSLARLIRALNTLAVDVTASWVLSGTQDHRTIDLALTAPEQVTSSELIAAAMSAGRDARVTEGNPEDAEDLPTRVLDGAAELVTNPGSAPLAAAALIEADRFEVEPAAAGQDDTVGVLRLQWTPERHVVLHRDWAPFARAEKTRASALLRLAAAISSAQGDADALGWVEPIAGGVTVWIRLARPEDADAVAAMHERCSEHSRYQRYFTPVSEWRDVNLRRLTGGHRGATLVVMSEDGVIVALGNVFPDAPTGVRAAELAMIVEDAYHGRGIGTRLMRHMVEFAERLGFVEVVATVLADNSAMLRVLEAPGLSWERTMEAGVLSMRARLPVGEQDTADPAG
ncbi:MAG: GNAT family N-acetyltransferase [Kineosporiaceae bacterium]|nr:GNAT family N-acetyltransferase [Kineosporiaceae bacterium]